MKRRSGAWAAALPLRALIAATARENPGRTALTVLAMALGVALGVAVHLVNASALNEFGLAARQLAGSADLVVRGPRAGFDESVYPVIARLPEVAAANPALELEIPLHSGNGSLHVVGFDTLVAVDMQPFLLPDAAAPAGSLLDSDAILLSHEAARWLKLGKGDVLEFTVGTGKVALKVVGVLAPGAYRQRLGIMDIASAQWRLGRLGLLNRIDLRMKPGTDVAAFRHRLHAMLPPGVHASTPVAESTRDAELTRAYRTNLNMLALIALFTGGFMVYSTQALALLRRRAQLALLRALGMTRRGVLLRLLAEGVTTGAVGSAAGVLLGCLVADYVVARIGADLGAGYFRALQAQTVIPPAVLVAYFTLGVLFAVLGTVVPAWEAARRQPARALRAGDEEDTQHVLRAPWGGLVAIVAAIPLIFAPSVDGIPVAGYLAIALLLLGTVMLLPWFTQWCLRRLPQPDRPVTATAIAQLQATPRQAAISVAAIVISLGLMASMLIMVHSFRASLDRWLSAMLPADLYVRAARAGETGYLDPAEQARLASVPGVREAAFVRAQRIFLDPERPSLTLIARPVDARRAASVLPLRKGSHLPRPGDPPPIWPSEVAAELHGLHPGAVLELPLAGARHSFTVAGIWRDYARLNGAIVIDRDLYTHLTGDRNANEAAIRIDRDRTLPEMSLALRAALDAGSRLEIAATRELREASLAVFDRTFAVTYALEIAAILIGLFGLAAGFSAQALARRREFGVLRHLGMTRGQIGRMLACEGMLVAAIGAACGLVSGACIGAILVHVVNRQSFHWSMDLVVPWLPLGGLAALIVLAAGLTAAFSGRAAMRKGAVMAVREDW